MYGGKFFPWTINIGAYGGNEMFILDKRGHATIWSYPFTGEDQDFIPPGKAFEEFTRPYNV
jgi:hypothetical protein